MGDKKTLEMARKELEDMYVGVADDSVNLSFQDLAQLMHKNADKKKLSPSSSTMEPISESRPSENFPASLAKLPSLDFSRALYVASLNHHHHQQQQQGDLNRHHGHNNQNHYHHQGDLHNPHGHIHQSHHQHHVDVHNHHTNHHGEGFRSPAAMEQRSFAYDDMSYMSNVSPMPGHGQERGGRRRHPGIPHSNICTVCSTYIYIFRHRCLVCGRVYCRQCVSMGMGEMKEGRKCIDCLGRRFSKRYIKKAGNIGCCFGYPSTVKQQELKWAEKGPRTRADAAYNRHSMVVPSPTTTGTPPTPTTTHHSNPPSSPYSHNSHHFSPL